MPMFRFLDRPDHTLLRIHGENEGGDSWKFIQSGNVADLGKVKLIDKIRRTCGGRWTMLTVRNQNSSPTGSQSEDGSAECLRTGKSEQWLGISESLRSTVGSGLCNSMENITIIISTIWMEME